MANKEYCNYILDLLSDFGNVSARSMFGGYGIYKDDLIFAIIANDVLYFKVDDTNRQNYQDKGSEPFSYEAKGKRNVAMSYWEVPADIIEDSNVLFEWADKSLLVSKNNQKPKKRARK